CLFAPPGSPTDCMFSPISRNRPTRGLGVPENSHQLSLSSLVRAGRFPLRGPIAKRKRGRILEVGYGGWARLSRSVDRSQSANERLACPRLFAPAAFRCVDRSQSASEGEFFGRVCTVEV